MNLLNQIKVHRAIDPDDQDNTAFTGQVLDKASFLPTGAKGVLFLVYTGDIAADLAALKVQQSDTKTDATTLGGSPTDVHDVTTKPANADDNSLWLVYVPMEKWDNQYLQLQATAGDGSGTESYLAAVAIADTPGEAGPTAALTGADNLEIA
jgi:hypothetical protein